MNAMLASRRAAGPFEQKNARLAVTSGSRSSTLSITLTWPVARIMRITNSESAGTAFRRACAAAR
jgi:hypothetical protein